jgi:hypothetical protein
MSARGDILVFEAMRAGQLAFHAFSFPEKRT